MNDIYVVSKTGKNTGELLSLVKGYCHREVKSALVRQPGALAFKLSSGEVKTLRDQNCEVKPLNEFPNEKLKLICQELNES